MTEALRPTTRYGSLSRKGTALASAFLFMLSACISMPASIAQQTREIAPAATQPAQHTARPQQSLPAAANAQAQSVQGQMPSQVVLKGQIDYTVPQGTPVKLQLASVPSHTMKLMDRDLDGNLLPAQLDQEITAKTTEDIYVDDNRVIPEGTVFHGKVSKIAPPRRLNRSGWLSISFDSLTTPDGRKFEFHAQADNFKQSTMKTKAKGLGRVAAYAGGGAIVGAMVAYQVFGIDKTIAMHGYNIAGGAAAGALLATGYAIMKKGARATLEPGDDLNMSFDSDLLMPAAQEPVAKAKVQNRKGVDIQILKSKMLKDGLDGHLLRLDVLITNYSKKPLNSIDLYLVDSEGNKCPICGGPEEFDEFLFQVDPVSEKEARVYFQVEWPKLKRELVWLDHHSRQICFRQKLN